MQPWVPVYRTYRTHSGISITISLTDCLRRRSLSGKQEVARSCPFQMSLPNKKQIKEVAPSLAQGKLNAVCAAFKAGVTPSRIARQFAIFQSDVRKAVAGDTSKRSV